jgi:hypothetical protein
LRQENSLFGVRTGNLARVNLYFSIAVLFDMVRSFGFVWASSVITICIYLIFSSIGLHSAQMYFCPESRGFKEAIVKLSSRLSFILYELVLLVWIVLYLVVPQYLVPTTLIMLAAVIVYPSTLFNSVRRRAKPSHIKSVMSILSVSWFSFVTLATFFFALGTQPPLLGISLPYSWEIALITGSGMVFLMSISVADPVGSAKLWTEQLIPQTIVKSGNRYLILHDSDKKTLSFLSSTLRTLIESGARIVVGPSRTGWLRASLSEHEPHYDEWVKNGKMVFSDTSIEPISLREGFSERLSLAPTSTVYVRELAREDLQNRIEPAANDAREKHQSSAEVFLVEDNNAPRPQLTEFLHQNNDMEFLNLSEANDSFSTLINMNREKVRGSTVLLEYDTNTDYESIVDMFLAEGLSNAELCVLFTTKSSKLYRSVKGKRMIKIIAASSLLQAPEERSDGEVEIPDKELGLVTSIVSDYVENSKGMGASFVFDSITELIRGERWEQIFSGIKQLNELLNSPNITAMFLANRNTTDPRFLGALHGEFQIQLRIDGSGLRKIKPAN